MSELNGGGMFALDPTDPRVIRGLLLPYGERARAHTTVNADGTSSTSSGDLYAAGDVEIPRDPAVATLNRDHDRFDPIGRAVELAESAGGVLAAFRVAETPEGDEYLAEYAGGKRKALSPEIAKYVNAAGDVVRRVLTGAAVVPAGAFASAHLYSIIEPPAGDDAADAAAELVELIGAEAAGEIIARLGVALESPETVESPAPVIAGDSTINDGIPAASAADVPNEPAPAELDETGDTPASPNGDTVGDVIAPASIAPVTAPTVTGVELITKGELFAAIAANQTQGVPIPERFARAGELFAFGSAAGNQADVFPVQLLGELWDGVPYVRKFAPLVAHGDLSSISLKGWKITTKPTVATWTGDGAAVDGAAVDVTPYTANATRKAGGFKIPREYFDFGETQFIDSAVRLQGEAYARQSDIAVPTALIAGATVLVSAATAFLPLLVDAALAIVAADDVPAFALANPADFGALANTKEVDKLAYIEISIDWGGGNVGGLVVLPYTGITALNVLVSSKNALRMFELPGSPIRVNAAAIQTGSVDEAVFGYYATIVEKSTSIQYAN